MEPDRPAAFRGVRARADRLFAEAGLRPDCGIATLSGGGNNRTFRVDDGKRAFLLKEYFRHPGDRRDRLGAEFAFARFAWKSGIRCLPEPVACDPERSVGLFRFVEGTRFPPGRPARNDVRQAVAFLAALNRCADSDEARALPDGSEACFSVRRHLEVVRRRIERLSVLAPTSPVERDAVAFVRTDLAEAYERVVRGIRRDAADGRISWGATLGEGERILSPSDFGFHNALQKPDGRVVFHDFEYAGWDDPAKLVGDFFSQVAVPVPLTHFDGVAAAVAACVRPSGPVVERMRVLLPLYRLKWCCILLNPFLPTEGARRRFAVPGASGRKREQLAKARDLLATLECFEEPGWRNAARERRGTAWRRWTSFRPFTGRPGGIISGG